MASKFQALYLTFAVAMGLTVIAISQASAQTVQLHSGSASGTTYLTGAQTEINPTLHMPLMGSIKCTTFGGQGAYAGTTNGSGTVNNLSITGCTAFGLNIHVDMMGCDLLVTDNTASTLLAHTVCPTTAGGVTDEVIATTTQGGVALCRIDIAEQTLTFNVSQMGTSPDDLRITHNNSAVTYDVNYFPPDHTKTKCGTEGTYHDGQITGSITVQAFSNATHATQVNLTYS